MGLTPFLLFLHKKKEKTSLIIDCLFSLISIFVLFFHVLFLRQEIVHSIVMS